jgi:hypothetical protein
MAGALLRLRSFACAPKRCVLRDGHGRASNTLADEFCTTMVIQNSAEELLTLGRR